MKYADEMLILGQNDILCGHSIVIFFSMISPTESMDFLTAWLLVTEPGLSLNEPGAVIKFNDFSSPPGTRMRLNTNTTYNYRDFISRMMSKSPNISNSWSWESYSAIPHNST